MKYLVLFVVFYGCSVDDSDGLKPSFDDTEPKTKEEIIFCRDNPRDCFCTQKIDCL